MVEETGISRRGFGKLLGGLLAGSAATRSSGGPLSKLPENRSYRMITVSDDFQEMDFPYDIEVKVEYGEPGEGVEYSRFLFEKDDLEDSTLEISSDILQYLNSKKSRTDEKNIDLGRKIFQEHFDNDIGEYHFARKIGETIELEKYLGVKSVESFDKAISKLNNSTGIEYKNGEFRKNHFSQSIESWMQTGW